MTSQELQRIIAHPLEKVPLDKFTEELLRMELQL
uniref:Uncharacterized protein n=1 Tax=Arundo donax TaxID=35708 RepID=A0A0A9BZ87_ARUDO